MTILPTLSQEDRLIVRECFYVVISTIGRKAKFPYLAPILEEVRQTLRNTPSNKLCKACLSLDPFTFVEAILYLEKNPREIIEYDFKNNECRLTSEFLHPGLQGHEIFSCYFKKLKSLEQLV